MTLRLTRYFFLFSAIASSLAWSAPRYIDPNQPYDRLPGTLETFHFKWANPLAGAQLNVLFIIPYKDSREVIELSQRMELHHTVIMNAGFGVWAEGYAEGPTATPLQGVKAKLVLQDIAQRRLSLGHNYDAIVIAKISWVVIPDDVKALILKHVERGSGLVYVSPNRLKEVLHSTLDVGGTDAQFSSLFETNSIPAAADSILHALPLDVMPLHVVKEHSAYKELTGIPRHQFAQASVNICAHKHGEGRVLALDYFDEAVARRNSNSLTPYRLHPDGNHDKVMYDYEFALLARAILWTVNRESDVALSLAMYAPNTELKQPAPDLEQQKRCWKSEQPKTVVDRDQLKDSKIAATLKFFDGDKRPPASFNLHLTLRDRAGEILVDNVQSLQIASGKPGFAEIFLPNLSRGTYLADARVTNAAGEVIDFMSRSFQVEAAHRVLSISADKDRYPEGETITGSIAFTESLTAGQSLSVTAVDTWGREANRGTLELADNRKQATYSLPVKNALTELWDIRCEIRDSKGLVDAKELPMPIPNWTFDEYMFMLIFSPTPGSGDWKGELHAQRLREFGINSTFTYLIYSKHEQFFHNARNHLRSVVYGEHLGEILDPSDHHVDLRTEQPQMDWAEVGRMARAIAETGERLDPKEFPHRRHFMSAEWLYNRAQQYKIASRFGTPYYTLTGENYLSGEFNGMENSGFGPTTTKRFQQWCREQYGSDLAALNREWNTSFKSWDEVRGILLRDADKLDQLPRWVDFRHFMRSRVWSQFFIDYTDMIRRYVPQATTGRVGHDHHDFTRYRKHMTSSKLYLGQRQNSEWHDAIIAELPQSMADDKNFLLAPQSMIRWTFDLEKEIHRKRWPWLVLFMGLNGFDWERGLSAETLGGEHCFTPDYSEPLPYFLDIAREVLFIQRGIGKLVIESKPHRNQVAMLWAPYNHYISRLNPFQPNGFSGTWLYNISTIGGAPSDCLALMNSLRIRPTIVAPEDLLNDGLQKRGFRALLLPYSKGMSVGEAEAIRKFVNEGGLVIADNEPGTFTEHGRKLDEPRLPDLFPTFSEIKVIHSGKGHAAYLPDILNGYIARLENCDYTGSDAVEALVKEYAGQNSPVELLWPNGLPRRDTLMRVFNNGSTRLVGLLRIITSEGKEPDETTMVLPAKYHVWDIRERTYHGYADRLNIRLDQHPRLFALLTSNINGMAVQSAVAKVPPGNEMMIKGSVEFGEAAKAMSEGIRHGIHIEVFSPEGKELEWFRGNHLFSGGAFEVKLPISFNAKPGRYRVIAEHVLTGSKAETTFDVEGK
ncbi:MAG: beta-galactosidase [Planctomycetota bacterium]|nr:beta-galactosidase [Planctomycetota bacterium]